MIAVVPLLFFTWKVLKRSKFYKPVEVDLLKNLGEIEEYEANYVPQPAGYVGLSMFLSQVRALTRILQQRIREGAEFPLRISDSAVFGLMSE